MNYKKYTLKNALDVLRDNDGIYIPSDAEDRLDRYFSLIREWNPFAGLVSSSDLAGRLQMAEKHLMWHAYHHASHPDRCNEQVLYFL